MRTHLAATAFGLNAAWEVAHWPLYECAWSPSVIAQAAAVDAAITVGVAEVASVVRPRSEAGFWPAFVTGLGSAALAIELWALGRGHRPYGRKMPRLGGVGLSPLAQLPVLGVAAVKLAGSPVRNQILIAHQRPDATHVAGFLTVKERDDAGDPAVDPATGEPQRGRSSS